MQQLYSNNASSTLSVAALSTDMTLTLASTGGFPVPTSGQFFLVTLSLGTQVEICQCAGVNTSTGVLTLSARGLEGTTAQPWSIGTYCEMRLTAGTISGLATNTELQSYAPAYLSGATASLGGTALAAGAVTTGTATISGAGVGQAVIVTPSTYPGNNISWEGYISASNTVTVVVTAHVAGTPVASVYNVRVLV